MQQLHPDPFQLLIFILISLSIFATLNLSGSPFQPMLPLIVRDSFPYLFVLVLGSWRRLMTYFICLPQYYSFKLFVEFPCFAIRLIRQEQKPFPLERIITS